MASTAPIPTELTIRRLAFAELTPQLERELSEFVDEHRRGDVFHQPSWLSVNMAEDAEGLGAFLLYRDAALCGFVPFVLRDHPLFVRIADFRLLTLPMLRLELLGASLLLPDDEAAYDLLFRAAVDDIGLKFDAISIQMVPKDSFLDAYLSRSEVIRAQYRNHLPHDPEPHHRIVLPPTFDEYMAKFGTKQRNTLRRAPRRLSKDVGGDLELWKAHRPEDVDRFVDGAVAVSQRSYQWHLLGAGLREPDQTRSELEFLAARGWMRCYLLYANGEPISFMIGYQYKGTYLYVDVAFDQQWRKQSPGTALQYLVLEEMYTAETPTTFEFGVHGEHKARFANETFRAESRFLFRRGFYPRAAASLYRLSDRVSETAGSLLERYNLKSRARQLIRRVSVRKQDGSTTGG